jgi:hypothetical protein
MDTLRRLFVAATLLVVPLVAGCASSAPTPASEPMDDAADAVARWQVLIQGNEAGEIVERPGEAPGELTYSYQYNDRGRGPEIESRYLLAGDGTPREVEVSGLDYLKAAVEERYRLADGTAAWTTLEEDETRPVDGPVFYTSAGGPPTELGLLAAAALDAPDGRLQVLPAGEAHAEVVGEATVSAPGRPTLDLRLVEVSGLGFEPVGLWLDADGRLFGLLSTWSAYVRDGYGSSVEDLLAAEQQRIDQRAGQRVDRLAHRYESVAITGARLFDPETLTVTPGITVVIEGERITAVGPDGTVATPAGAHEIEARGRTLLPGLWDLHTHLADLHGLLHIASGVTSVRDLANDVDTVTRLQREWAGGQAIGPRVWIAGFLDGPGPYAGPTKALVSTFDEAKEWIDRYHELGFIQVKLYSSLDPELVEPIAEYAHSLGMKVSGHLPYPLVASQAIERGFDEIQHVNFLFLTLFDDTSIDTRTPQRFTVPAERSASIDLDSPEVAELIDLLLENDVAVDPTLSIFEGMITAAPGEVSPPFAAVADRFPATFQRGLRGGGLEPPEGRAETYREAFRRMVEMVGRLHAAGVPVLPGTDSLAGFALHRELELYVEAGIPAPEVLRLATLDAARHLGEDDELGTIEPGKLADLILVDGNPDQEIEAIRGVDVVVKGGVVYWSDALYGEVGVRPAGM